MNYRMTASFSKQASQLFLASEKAKSAKDVQELAALALQALDAVCRSELDIQKLQEHLNHSMGA